MSMAKPFLACSLFAFPAAVGLAASLDVVPAVVAAPLGFGLMFTCGTLSLLFRPAEPPPQTVDRELRADG